MQRQIERTIITVEQFPEDLEERANAVLSCINSEFKSATLGFFLDDRWKTMSDIRREAKRYFGPLDIDLIPGHKSFKEYCTETFIPIGAVAEGKIKYSNRKGFTAHYKLTEAGETYAKPIARFALKVAVDIGLSMDEVFGRTASRGETRSPLNTAKILFELKKEKNLRVADLINRIGLNQTGIKRHLLHLKTIGLVNYDSVSLENPGWSKYEWVEGKNPEDVKKIRTYSLKKIKKVANKMQEIGVSERNKLAKTLNIYTSDASKILSGLEKQGFVRKKTKFKTNEKLSEASIKERGRKFVKHFLEPVYQTLQDNFDPIYQEIAILDNFSTACDYVSRGFGLYARICPAYKKESPQIIKSKILGMLEEETLRPKEINETLGKGCFRYLRELLDEGLITKERKGKAVHYSLKL